LKGDCFRLGIGPLDKPDLWPHRRHHLKIDWCAPEVGLHSQAQLGEVGMQHAVDVKGVRDVVRLLHVDLDYGADGLGLGSQNPQVVDA
jgi:hypothetical protein